MIDQIALQTNLLALNAGVEAALAGEAGRGFASSPRKSANSRNSAPVRAQVAEIADLVGGIASSARGQFTGLSEANAAVNRMDHMTQQNAA